jgi:hypothetical protein
LVFDVKAIKGRADKMNIVFSPTKYEVKAGYEMKDQGSERLGLWKTLGFGDKTVRIIIEWRVEMTNTGRAKCYSLTAMTNARKYRMIHSNNKYR